MTAFRNRLALAALVSASVCIGNSHAFAPQSLGTRSVGSGATKEGTLSSKVLTVQRALPMDDLNDLVVTWDQIQQSASHFLAEETAVVGEATGWWGAYVNLFKSTLLWLHATIDGPLRSVGFDQTWGVSIGLFTLRKFVSLLNISTFFRRRPYIILSQSIFSFSRTQLFVVF